MTNIHKHPKANTNGFDKRPQDAKKGGRHLSVKYKLKKMLADQPEKFRNMVQALIDKAEKGDLKAFGLIIDHIDGKPKQSVDHTSSDGTAGIPVRKWVETNTEEEE